MSSSEFGENLACELTEYQFSTNPGDDFSALLVTRLESRVGLALSLGVPLLA